MNELDALSVLRARFPHADISIGYIGNTYGSPGTRAWRDERAYFVFTNLTEGPGSLGRRIALPLPHGPREINVEEITLALQSRIVHNAREMDGTLQSCPCERCTVRRVRATLTPSIWMS